MVIFIPFSSTNSPFVNSLGYMAFFINFITKILLFSSLQTIYINIKNGYSLLITHSLLVILFNSLFTLSYDLGMPIYCIANPLSGYDLDLFRPHSILILFPPMNYSSIDSFHPRNYLMFSPPQDTFMVGSQDHSGVYANIG